MELQHIGILIFIGTVLFYLGWTLGRWRLEDRIEKRRKARADQIIKQMFDDIHGQFQMGQETREDLREYQSLRDRLEEALRQEDYESAAQLRDLLKDDKED